MASCGCDELLKGHVWRQWEETLKGENPKTNVIHRTILYKVNFNELILANLVMSKISKVK